MCINNVDNMMIDECEDKLQRACKVNVEKEIDE